MRSIALLEMSESDGGISSPLQDLVTRGAVFSVSVLSWARRSAICSRRPGWLSRPSR